MLWCKGFKSEILTTSTHGKYYLGHMSGLTEARRPQNKPKSESESQKIPAIPKTVKTIWMRKSARCLMAFTMEAGWRTPIGNVLRYTQTITF